LDVLHGSGVPYFLVEVVETHYYVLALIKEFKLSGLCPILLVKLQEACWGGKLVCEQHSISSKGSGAV
jgi:hypothetical protein